MKHLLPAEQRVAEASQAACDLAFDAIHDAALQEALARRNAASVSLGATRAELLSCIRNQQYPDRENYLIDLMVRTADPIVCDAAAYALAELHSAAGGAAIAKLLASNLMKNSSSLLYAVNKLNMSLDIDHFVKLITKASLDVRYECLLLLEKGRFTFTGKAALKRSIDTLRQMMSRTGHRNDYLGQIIEVLVAASLR
jgi:hypothetical protein